MEVNPDDPGATIEYNGRTFYFCSKGCSEQ
ncbi:MAG: copper-transporting ATPase, partial [Halalkalicoccus sp.]|nr:copper-transporting ATPase [Halalkalicoccus sp.]